MEVGLIMGMEVGSRCLRSHGCDVPHGGMVVVVLMVVVMMVFMVWLRWL